MFTKKKLQNPEIGMVVSDQGISVVNTEADSGISKFKHFAAGDWSGLTSWVQQHKLSSKSVHLVLDNKQYQLNQVEPPAVPEEDMNSALLYSLRDRLDHKMDEVQIDHFSFPGDAHRGAVKKVNVVTAHAPTLKQHIAGMDSAGLQIAVIDIAELALRNLLLENDNMGKGVCLLAYHENFVTFMIYRNSELYLTRNVMINSWQDCISSDEDIAKEGLLLEVQRTLDYYQSQLVQPPVAELVIPDWSTPLTPLINYLADNLAMKVSKLSCRNDEQEFTDSNELRQLMLAGSALNKTGMKSRDLNKPDFSETGLKVEQNHAEG